MHHTLNFCPESARKKLNAPKLKSSKELTGKRILERLGIQTSSSFAVNDRRYVFHFRPKLNIWPEKHLALGRIPKLKPKVQIYLKIGRILP